MFDLSQELEKFLKKHVILHSDQQNKLRNKKRLNIKRLKQGLIEFNHENHSDFKIVENTIQGSMAMYTVIQKEENNYDIDVAVVFEKEKCKDSTAASLRKLVESALEKTTKQFNARPEVKTSCVRLQYEEGYHIDFAIFRREYDSFYSKYIYDHAGANWTKRHINGVEDWFQKNNESSSGLLRKIVRLLKHFSSTKNDMPGGLIQTALCTECLASYERLDISFYETMKKISCRLNHSKEISIPVDGGRSISSRKTDIDRIEKLKNALYLLLEKLSILEKDQCTREQALNAWYSVFAHDYWQNMLNESLSFNDSNLPLTYDHTEQFIEDKYRINEIYDVKIEATIMSNGFRPMTLDKYLSSYSWVKHGLSIECECIGIKFYDYDHIFWKVKNEGWAAKERNEIRGQIVERDSKISEKSLFQGNHYIECYLIKNGICAGIGHIDIPIGEI